MIGLNKRHQVDTGIGPDYDKLHGFVKSHIKAVIRQCALFFLYACLLREVNCFKQGRIRDEIVLLPDRVGTHSGRGSIFCLSRQDERVDVSYTGNPGQVSQNHGVIGNGSGPVASLFV